MAMAGSNMIRKLLVEGFQRHRSLLVRLDPGVTTIVGPSDVGKSAVLRSLRWLAVNKPRGTSFVRHGAKKARVTLRIDGHTVARTRRGSSNTYTLDGKKFRAFGNDVPQEVAQLLALDDANFQCQHDPPFWLSLSPAEAARQLNDFVDLSVIDRTMERLAASLRKEKVVKAVAKQNRAAARAERKSLEWSRRCSKNLEEVEALEVAQKEASGRRARLEHSLHVAKEAEACRRNAGEFLELAEEAERAGNDWEKRRRVRKQLESLVEALRETTAAIAVTKEALPALAKVVEAGERAVEAKRSRSLLANVVRDARELRDLLEKDRATATELEKKFRDAMGEICQLCGQTIQ